jgi:surface antigen
MSAFIYADKRPTLGIVSCGAEKRLLMKIAPWQCFLFTANTTIIMKKLYQFGKIASLASATLITGCMGGSLGNNAGYPGGGYSNQGYPNPGYPNAGNPYGGNPYGGYPYGGYPNTGAQSGNNPVGSLQGAVIAAIIQGMAGSVLNGQIGSQLAPVDQNFRLQQLGGLLQSGTVNQSQQWLNPQTGSKVAVNPIGQLSLNPQTRQKCQNLEETLTLPDGKNIREKRIACLDPKTGKWNLIK